MLFKKCWECGETKPFDEFYNNRTTKDKKQARCIPCQKVDTRKLELRRKALMHNIKKNAGCAFCGTRRPQVLVFHHVDPDKKVYQVGQSPCASLSKFFSEIVKCIVLCRNCHAELHYAENT